VHTSPQPHPLTITPTLPLPLHQTNQKPKPNQNQTKTKIKPKPNQPKPKLTQNRTKPKPNQTKPNQTSTESPPGDPSVLRFLIAAREEVDSTQLRDDLLSMLVAGHETTGSALTWTLYLLATNPSTMVAAHVSASWRPHGSRSAAACCACAGGIIYQLVPVRGVICRCLLRLCWGL